MIRSFYYARLYPPSINVEMLNSALSNYATIDSVPIVGIAEYNLDDTVQSGFYRLEGAHANLPSGTAYGQLLVIQGAGDTITQLAFDYDSTYFWWRSGNTINNASGSWGAWRQVVWS